VQVQSLASKHNSPADADNDLHRGAAVRALLSAIADGEAVLTLDGAGDAARRAVMQDVAATLQGAGVRVLHIDAAARAGARQGLRDVLAQAAGQEPNLDRDGGIDELLDLLNGGDPAGVVLAVDDADQLQTDALEFFRLLAAMGRGQRHRSRMVLAGPVGFADRFERPASDKRPRLIDRRVALAPMPEAAPPEPASPAEAPSALSLSLPPNLSSKQPLAPPTPRARGWPRAVTAAALVLGAGAAGAAWQVRGNWPLVATLAADPMPVPMVGEAAPAMVALVVEPEVEADPVTRGAGARDRRGIAGAAVGSQRRAGTGRGGTPSGR
jgi:type II secretory pathway predicted ATPase ExeA